MRKSAYNLHVVKYGFSHRSSKESAPGSIGDIHATVFGEQQVFVSRLQ